MNSGINQMCNFYCRYRYVLALLCLVMTSCKSVGPEYKHPPEMMLPETWNQHIGQTQAAVDLSTWWVQFNDPVLNSLIMHAELRNLDLRVAIARILEAELQYGITSSLLYPSLDSSATYSRGQQSENQLGIPTQTDNSRSIGLSLSWELDLFGRIKREKEAAASSIGVSIEDYRDVLVILNANIASLYVESKVLQERLALAFKNVENQSGTLNIVQARYNADLVSEIDLTRAQQNLARTRSLIPTLRASQTQTLNRLAELSGLLPGSLDQLILSSASMPIISEQVLTAIPRDVIRQRPDIRRAERSLAVQTALIGVAKADLYPRFSLAGIFGFATLSGELLSSDSNFWSLGPQASWSIFNAGSKRKRIKVEEMRLEQAKVQYEQAVLTALEDVENSLTRYVHEQQRLNHLQTSTKAATKTVKLAKERYRLGLTSFQEVLDAERVLFAEEDSLAISQGALILQFIDIYRAMGGGWDATQAVAFRDKPYPPANMH